MEIRRKKDLFYSLFYIINGYKIQCWARLNSGTREFHPGLPHGGRAHILEPSSTVFLNVLAGSWIGKQ